MISQNLEIHVKVLPIASVSGGPVASPGIGKDGG